MKPIEKDGILTILRVARRAIAEHERRIALGLIFLALAAIREAGA